MDDDASVRLVLKARERDPESLAALCEQVYPKLVGYMHYRVGAALAEDMAGEVLVRVLRGIGNQRGSFLAWLYRIAANVVADHARSASTKREEPMNEDAVQLASNAAEDPAETARRLDIQAALSGLTEDQREFIILKFIQGLSNAEVGEITGRKPEAVRALQFRALRALRDLLGGAEDE